MLTRCGTHAQDEQQAIASLAAVHVGNDADGDDVPSEAVLRSLLVSLPVL